MVGLGVARTQEDTCDLLGAEKTSVGMAGKSLHSVLPCSGTWMSRSLLRELSSGEHQLWGWEGRGDGGGTAEKWPKGREESQAHPVS